MLKLKVCGMRDEENIRQLQTIQPDFIGFIFHQPSSRYVETPVLLPQKENTKYVGVFVNAPLEDISSKIDTYQLDYVQLHGSESPELCKAVSALNIKVIKAFNISTNTDFDHINTYAPYCSYFLFDSTGKHPGGNGICFNWEILKHYKGNTPFFLSGGIDLSMAWKIKYLDHPKLFAIDINSKFEYKPALKNINDITTFKDELQH